MDEPNHTGEKITCASYVRFASRTQSGGGTGIAHS
jgi:hypothetical protein